MRAQLAEYIIDGNALVGLVVWLIVAGLICWVLWWLIGYIGLPAPFDKAARVVVALIAAIIVINALLGLGGHPLIEFSGWRRY